jgi:hypothetical protein
MATLKCLACGHDNNVGDESCSSCSSSLNLKLCSACEAINANNAERCHSCNAQFRIEPEVVTFEMDAPPGEHVEEASPPGRALPAVWQIAARQARKRSTRSAAALAVLPLLVAGLAYYFYVPSQAPSEPAVAVKVEPARRSELPAAPEPARSEPVRQPAAELKQAQPPAVSGKIAPPRTAAAPSRSTPPSEPKRTTAAVTHTRAAGAEASSRTTAAEAPRRTTAARAPTKTTIADTPTKSTAGVVPVAVTPVPAANAAIIPVSEAPVAIAESKPMSVTHTKADPTEAAVPTTVPAVVTQARTVPGEATNDQPAGCPPAVLALGLCKSK